MNIALRTTFHRATARRSARVTATAPCGSKLTIPWPDEPAGHRRAADGLRDKLGLSGSLVGGQLGDGSFVFCFAPRNEAAMAACKAVVRWAKDEGVYGTSKEPACVDMCEAAIT